MKDYVVDSMEKIEGFMFCSKVGLTIRCFPEHHKEGVFKVTVLYGAFYAVFYIPIALYDDKEKFTDYIENKLLL